MLSKEFFSGDPRQNEFYKDGKVQININSPRAMSSTFDHEAYHFLRAQDKNEKLNTFENFLLNNAGTLLQNDSLDNAIQNKMAEYRQYGVDLTLYDAKEEVFADAVGRLFEDDGAIQHLYKTDRNLFQRVYDWIVHTIFKIGKDTDTKLLMDAQRKFVLAMQESSGVLRENADNSPMASYVGTDANGIRYYESDMKKYTKKESVEYFEALADLLLENENIQMDFHGNVLDINVHEDFIGETKHQDKTSLFKDITKMLPYLADIIENSKWESGQPEKKKSSSTSRRSRRHRDFVYWDYFKTTIFMDGKPFDIRVNVVTDKQGDKKLYQVLAHKNRKGITADPSISQVSSNSVIPFQSITSVPQGAQGVNTQNEKYSFGDSLYEKRGRGRQGSNQYQFPSCDVQYICSRSVPLPKNAGQEREIKHF